MEVYGRECSPYSEDEEKFPHGRSAESCERRKVFDRVGVAVAV